jgi:hypothetical protein
MRKTGGVLQQKKGDGSSMERQIMPYKDLPINFKERGWVMIEDES